MCFFGALRPACNHAKIGKKNNNNVKALLFVAGSEADLAHGGPLEAHVEEPEVEEEEEMYDRDALIERYHVSLDAEKEHLSLT